MSGGAFDEIRVRDLRLFDRLVVLGTITAAARELGVPKPTAGRWLAQLEARVGHVLVRRSSRHASLTEEGRAFHIRAQAMLAAFDALELAMASEATGTLRVSVPVPLGRMLGGEVIAAFRRRMPGVRLEIALQNERVDLVRDRFDLAIRGGRLPSSELIARKLGVAPLYLYASARDAGTGLRELAWIASPGDAKLLRGRHPDRSTPDVLIDDRGALAEALVAGAGMGILPAFLGEPECERGLLTRVESEPLAKMPVHAVFLPAQRDDPRLRALIDELARVLVPSLLRESGGAARD